MEEGLVRTVELPGKRIYFFDWRYVHPGSFRWNDASGKRFPLWHGGEIGPASWVPSDFPFGVTLVPQQAKKGEPLALRGETWDSILWHGTVQHDEGRYRLWYEAVSPEDYAAKRSPGNKNLFCFAESDDAVTWHKPALPYYPYGDAERTNVVYGGRLCDDRGFHGAGVFRDPSAPAAERYKLIHFGEMRGERLARYLETHPREEVDAHAWRQNGALARALYGAVSPDGLRWTPLPDPLLAHMADTQNVCEYDPDRGEYVAYVRAWQQSRRCIGRVGTKDFGRWPRSEIVLTPADGLGPSAQWYANAKSRYPHAPEIHLMFPMEWRTAEDRYYPHLATSVDNAHWSLVPGGSVVTPGPSGAWDEGGAYMGAGLVPLPGNRVGALYAAWRIPHKYPRNVPFVELAWASWPEGRMVGLRAAEQGEFSTQTLRVDASRATLNVRTGPTGSVRVEAVGTGGERLPGRSFADSTPITGDHAAASIAWGAETSFGQAPGAPLRLRFRLYDAELFGIEFE
jgi:hypothetical protein